MGSWRCAFLILVLGGCGGASERPEWLQVVDLGPEGYGLREVSAGSLETVSPLRGRAAVLEVDASIRFPERFPRDRGLDRGLFVSDARAASPRVELDAGVARALDLDSLGLLTGFALLDRAVDELEALGVLFPGPVPVYYAPRFPDADALSLPESDNAAYLRELDAFALLPTEVLDGIPLAMNPGVLLHELAHRLFYYRAFDARLFETLRRVDGQPGVGATFNRMRAVDEGVADFIAASFMNDPAYLDPSVVGTTIGRARDLGPIRDFPDAWLDGLEPREGGAYDPYAVGVLFASTLWAISGDYGQGATRAALLDGLSAVRPALVDDFEFRFGDLLREVIRALPGDLSVACAHAAQRYSAARERLAPVCP